MIFTIVKKQAQKAGIDKSISPHTFTNFLALLGWNPGNEEEVFSMNELIQNFDLRKVNSSGAKFDVEKLKWFNHKYLQEEKDEKIADHLMGQNVELKNTKKELVSKAVALTKERANTMTEVWPLCSYLFVRAEGYNKRHLPKSLLI